MGRVSYDSNGRIAENTDAKVASRHLDRGVSAVASSNVTGIVSASVQVVTQDLGVDTSRGRVTSIDCAWIAIVARDLGEGATGAIVALVESARIVIRANGGSVCAFSGDVAAFPLDASVRSRT